MLVSPRQLLAACALGALILAPAPLASQLLPVPAPTPACAADSTGDSFRRETPYGLAGDPAHPLARAAALPPAP
jgi:hypothetical protein